MLEPDTLVVRGGSMPRAAVVANIRDVRAAYDRNGLCVKALIDREVSLAGDRLLPHARICLTTPLLLEAAGFHADLEPTNDLGDRYQYTLWLPEGDPSSLVDQVWTAFRGPFLKGEASDAWTTEDLRGLQCPGP
jgi:hypothetical protein